MIMTTPAPRRDPFRNGRILPFNDPRIAADRRAAYDGGADIAEVRGDPSLRRAAHLATLDLGALVLESHISLALIRRRPATANGRADRLARIRACAATLRKSGAV